jgi:hypothetical protein
MKCSYDKERLAFLLTDSVDGQERMEIEFHLAGCADCQMEFKSYKKVWQLMNQVESAAVPETMGAAFNAMLAQYKAETNTAGSASQHWRIKLINLFHWQQTARFAYSLVVLIIGLAAGWLLHQPAKQAELSYNKQVDSLSLQMAEMKQMMMLSLLENPSASQRIQAVGYTDEIGTGNKKVIEALLTTLNEDPNVNVRLMTLEALAKLAKDPVVREGLVQSISMQDSPLLQSAIADVMVKLQEKKSIASFRQLLTKKDLNEMVRLKIEQSIHKLI